MKTFEKFEKSIKALNDILSSHKSANDKAGLGFKVDQKESKENANLNKKVNLKNNMKTNSVRHLNAIRICTLDFGIDPGSFKIVDGIHDDILLSPESEIGHWQLLCGRGLDEVAARSTHPI
ncbi:hypothetical protein KI387_030067, partial [Taxus chinensis]